MDKSIIRALYLKPQGRSVLENLFPRQLGWETFDSEDFTRQKEKRSVVLPESEQPYTIMVRSIQCIDRGMIRFFHF